MFGNQRRYARKRTSLQSKKRGGRRGLSGNSRATYTESSGYEKRDLPLPPLVSRSPHGSHNRYRGEAQGRAKPCADARGCWGTEAGLYYYLSFSLFFFYRPQSGALARSVTRLPPLSRDSSMWINAGQGRVRGWRGGGGLLLPRRVPLSCHVLTRGPLHAELPLSAFVKSCPPTPRLYCRSVTRTRTRAPVVFGFFSSSLHEPFGRFLPEG